MNRVNFDKIILGAGIYGLYAARMFGNRGERVLVLECDTAPFARATSINQARIHMGYHYPRSYATARKSASYFDRFCDEFKSCTNSAFNKIYAISRNLSWTNAEQFEKFCSDLNIPCEAVSPNAFFREEACEGAYLTREYVFDANLILEQMLNDINRVPGVTIRCGAVITCIEKHTSHFTVNLQDGARFSTGFLLNTTYASVNQVLNMLEAPLFRIKYELCEIILCSAGNKLKDYRITVMDGPFFSLMPFGSIGFHSLTSVTFTPLKTSFDDLPQFACQARSAGTCTPLMLGNCNSCPARPPSAWPYMAALARKYLKPGLDFSYEGSLYSIKPILLSSEVDDSRPTIIRCHSEEPACHTVLSGKINIIYDLEEVF